MLSNQLLLLLLLLLLLPPAVLFIRYCLQPRGFAHLPSPPSPPIFGHALKLTRFMREHETVSDFLINFFAKPLGPVTVLYSTTFKASLIIAEHRLVDHIFTDKAWDRGKTLEDLFGGLAPLGMLSIKTDARMKLHKRALAPTMSPSFLAFASTIFSQNLEVLIQLWHLRLTIAQKGGEGADLFWNAEEDLHSLTTDAISHITFGETFLQLTSELRDVEQHLANLESDPSVSPTNYKQQSPGGRHPIAAHMQVLFQSLSAGIAAGLQHRFQRMKPSYQVAIRSFHKFVDDKVAASRLKLANGGEVAQPESVVDIVLQKASTGGEGSVLPEADLRDELVTFLIAGEETSSTTMCWILKFLSENPRVQRRLYRELVKVLPSPDERSPTYDEVCGKTTPYLEAFVHEVLRVGQSVRATSRQATKDTTLFHPTSGTPIVCPKGTNVILLLGYSCCVSSDDPLLGWQGEDVEVFRPERWLVGEGGAFDPNAGPSLPFASGPRMCFGLKMALLFLRLFTAQLSLSFFVAPIPEQHRTERCVSFVTRRPKKNWVGLREWKEVECAEDEGVVLSRKGSE